MFWEESLTQNRDIFNNKLTLHKTPSLAMLPLLTIEFLDPLLQYFENILTLDITIILYVILLLLIICTIAYTLPVFEPDPIVNEPKKDPFPHMFALPKPILRNALEHTYKDKPDKPEVKTPLEVYAVVTSDNKIGLMTKLRNKSFIMKFIVADNPNYTLRRALVYVPMAKIFKPRLIAEFNSNSVNVVEDKHLSQDHVGIPLIESKYYFLLSKNIPTINLNGKTYIYAASSQKGTEVKINLKK